MKTKYFMIISFLILISCFPKTNEKQLLIKNSQKYLPSEEEKISILQSLNRRNNNFDSSFNMLKSYSPENANHYHTAMVGTWGHGYNPNAQYATDLLDSGDPEMQKRAFAVWHAVIAGQDQDSSSHTYGIWPYYLEELLEQMNNPDWNWADFIGVQLLESYMKHYDVLPDTLKESMKDAIIHASRSIQKRDVKPTYTNIAIMGTLVTYLASHLFDIPDMKEYADMRLKRFYDFTQEIGGFTEYNSPTYTVVALDELVRMKQYIIDPEALKMINYCYQTGWKTLATHFHPPSGQLAGPHSRSYSTFIRKNFYDFLYGASDGIIYYNQAKMPWDYYKLRHKIPEDYIPMLNEISKERIQIDTFGAGKNPEIGYTYLHPDFCFATINRSTTWQQRRPFIAYWGDPENPGYFRVILLHDFIDFGIGNIFSVQDSSTALTALNFSTDGGDYHISLDRIKDACFRAKDIRLRFEMADSQLYEKIILNSDGFKLLDSSFCLDVKMLHAKFDQFRLKIEKGQNDRLCWVDWIIYEGKEKEFVMTKLDHAAFGWYTYLNQCGETKGIESAQCLIDDGTMKLSTNRLFLSVPLKPLTEEELQASFRIIK